MLKYLSVSNFQDILNATHRKNSGIQLAILTRSLHFVFAESSVRDLYCVTKITRRRRSTWSGTNPSPMVCSLHLSGKDPNYQRKTLHHLLCPSYLQTPFPPSNHPVPFLPSNPHNCFLWPSSAKSSHLIHIFMTMTDFNLHSGNPWDQWGCPNVGGNPINSQGLFSISLLDCFLFFWDVSWHEEGACQTFLQEIELPFTGVGARSRLSKSCWDAFVVHSVLTQDSTAMHWPRSRIETGATCSFVWPFFYRTNARECTLKSLLMSLTVPTYWPLNSTELSKGCPTLPNPQFFWTLFKRGGVISMFKNFGANFVWF